jgi:hypothetical protein
MTSRFILNKLDLDLTPASFFLRFRFVSVFIIVFSSTFCSVMVVDKAVISDGSRRLARVSLVISGCYVTWMHVESALTFTHNKGANALGKGKWKPGWVLKVLK